jgi:DNA-binding Lrp family transcriptional regulator
MQVIFVQIKCELGRAYDVAATLVDRELCSEVYSTSGHYDLLTKIYIPEGQDVGHYVMDRIQRVPGIRDTFTIMALKAFS